MNMDRGVKQTHVQLPGLLLTGFSEPQSSHLSNRNTEYLSMGIK